MHDFSNLLLRWSIGTQDTTSLSDYQKSKFLDFLWLAKLSIISFQKYFPNARFVILYNGDDIQELNSLLDSINISFTSPVDIIDQRQCVKDGTYTNPYHFYPMGVWWKWIPFRLDISKCEIAVDTDILCLYSPETWYKWIFDLDDEILIAPERYEEVAINTTGDFCNHPLLSHQLPYNCGVVGEKPFCDYGKQFFEVTQSIDFGNTHNSLFITEQGAINIWIRSMEMCGVKHNCLEIDKNTWVRDFLYFMSKNVNIETIHAVAWHKEIIKKLKNIFESRIINNKYEDQKDFMTAIIQESSVLDAISKFVLSRQLSNIKFGNEILIQKGN